VPRYWWVNHKQTARRMIEGGYLWSPKFNVRKSDGGTINNETYNNMRRVNPGDLIVSFSFLRIAFVGRATAYAFTSKKPLALAPLDTAWGDFGWLLPVSWTRLQNPVEPRQHIDLIRGLFPGKYSPMKPDGNGNQNVFLSEISAELFETLVGLAHFDPSLAEVGPAQAPTPELIDDEVAQRIINSDEVPETEKEAIVVARRGQGRFRQNVSQQESWCRLTGVANPSLLIASHIKPWRDCEPGERLDGSNGLLLTPNADRLFDRGFITFHDEGDVEISSRIPSIDVRGLGFGEAEVDGKRTLQLARPKPFTRTQRQYLDYHRQQVFLPPA